MSAKWPVLSKLHWSSLSFRRGTFWYSKRNRNVPDRASYGVYISQLIAFNHVADFKALNECLTAKRLQLSRAIGIFNFEKHFLNFIADTIS